MADYVVFRQFKLGCEAVAFLPGVPVSSPGLCVCYVRLGQHMEASMDCYYKETVPARMDERVVRELYAELVKLGYDVRPRRRMPAWHRLREARRGA